MKGKKRKRRGQPFSHKRPIRGNFGTGFEANLFFRINRQIFTNVLLFNFMAASTDMRKLKLYFFIAGFVEYIAIFRYLKTYKSHFAISFQDKFNWLKLERFNTLLKALTEAEKASLMQSMDIFCSQIQMQKDEAEKKYIRSHILVLQFISLVRFQFVRSPKNAGLHRLMFWIHFWEMIAFGAEELFFKNKSSSPGLTRFMPAPSPIMIVIIAQAVWLGVSFRSLHPHHRLLS